VDIYHQPIQGGAHLGLRAQAFWRTAGLVAPLGWVVPLDTAIQGVQPELYLQPIQGTGGLGLRALAFWRAGAVVYPFSTFVSLDLGAPVSDPNAMASSLQIGTSQLGILKSILAQSVLWGSTSDLGTPTIPPDTYSQPLQGGWGVPSSGRAFWLRAGQAAQLGWTPPEDLSSAPAPTELYIQPILGTASWLAIQQAFAQRAIVIAPRGWPIPEDLSAALGAQTDPYLQPILGLDGLAKAGRASRAAGLQAMALLISTPHSDVSGPLVIILGDNRVTVDLPPSIIGTIGSNTLGGGGFK
jgi:hypothetical protein